MTIDEFSIETIKIENFYDKAIPEEQKKVWFQELKKMNVQRFRLIISEVYRRNKFLPKLADIIEIDKELGNTKKKEPEANDCKLCNGTGYQIYIKEDNGTKYQFGAICSCRKQKQYIGWNVEGEKSSYYIPYIEQIGG